MQATLQPTKGTNQNDDKKRKKGINLCVIRLHEISSWCVHHDELQSLDKEYILRLQASFVVRNEFATIIICYSYHNMSPN